ncbi:MAG TPA: S-layer homology domain-containing protein [Limnochordia bacterium]|nr:S-layer homology domain-containing protein [Limnochordia bacterium]
MRGLLSLKAGLIASGVVVVLAAAVFLTPEIEQRLLPAAQHPAQQQQPASGSAHVADPYLTRAQFAKLLADRFDLADGWANPFTDVGENHWARPAIDAVVQAGWMEAYAGGRFAPEQHISEAEALDGVLKALQIPGDLREAKLGESTAQPFGLAVAKQLGLWPAATPFNERARVTPEQAKSLLAAATKLDRFTGKLKAENAEAHTLTLVDDAGKAHTLTVAAKTPLVRNTVPAQPGELLAGDSLFALADAKGNVKLLAARGQITKDDLSGKLAGMTQGVLTPDVVRALLDSDWATAEKSLSGVAYDRLTAAGATPKEAEAAVNQNWTQLRTLLVGRAAHALGGQLGLSTNLIDSMLAGDWTTARDQAEANLAQELLNRYMTKTGSNDALGFS